MIRPLRDRICVKMIEYKHPILAVVGVTLNKGVVIAVGPGRKIRRKQRFDAAQGMMGRSLWFEDGEETGKIGKMHVKPGDFIEFSPRQSVPFTLDGEDYVMIKQGAVYGITNDSQSQAMLWQQSAGYDRQGNFMSGKETALQ